MTGGSADMRKLLMTFETRACGYSGTTEIEVFAASSVR